MSYSCKDPDCTEDEGWHLLNADPDCKDENQEVLAAWVAKARAALAARQLTMYVVAEGFQDAKVEVDMIPALEPQIPEVEGEPEPEPEHTNGGH